MGWTNISPWKINHGQTPQSVSVGVSSVTSTNAVGSNAVYLCSTTDCRVDIGTSPTATASSLFLPANQPLVLGCGTTDKVAAIQDSAAGTLSVVSVTH